MGEIRSKGLQVGRCVLYTKDWFLAQVSVGWTPTIPNGSAVAAACGVGYKNVFHALFGKTFHNCPGISLWTHLVAFIDLPLCSFRRKEQQVMSRNQGREADQRKAQRVRHCSCQVFGYSGSDSVRLLTRHRDSRSYIDKNRT